MDIKELIRFVSEYGFMTVFASMGLYMLYMHISQTIKKGRTSDPLNHLFFTRINQFMNNEIIKLINIRDHKIGCKDRREEVIKKMLTIKFKIWSDNFKKYIIDTPRKKMNNTEIYNSLIKFIENTIEKYNKERLADNTIPNFIVEKFNEFHGEKVNLLEKSIFDIIYTDFFHTNQEKLNAILEMNLTLLYMTIIDMKEVFLKYNGEFDRVLCK